MNVKVAGMGEHLAALPTLVGFFASVDVLVPTHAVFSERLAALSTFVGFLSTVSSLMMANLVAFAEHTSTLCTCEVVLPRHVALLKFFFVNGWPNLNYPKCTCCLVQEKVLASVITHFWRVTRLFLQVTIALH